MRTPDDLSLSSCQLIAPLNFFPRSRHPALICSERSRRGGVGNRGVKLGKQGRDLLHESRGCCTSVGAADAVAVAVEGFIADGLGLG